MSRKPTSWEEFRRAYIAGDCRVEVLDTSLDWARRAGWRLNPNARENRARCAWAFVLASLLLISLSIFGRLESWAPILGIPLLACFFLEQAGEPTIREREEAFIAKMLTSEQAFWTACQNHKVELSDTHDRSPAKEPSVPEREEVSQ